MSESPKNGREAVLLTGGASRRMGTDKASLDAGNGPLGPVLARGLSEANWPVTVLGRDPISGFDFLQDEGDFQGPIVALKKFQPARDLVFVLSCDVPLFDPKTPDKFLSILGEGEAVIPSISGKLQPLCALYRSSAWSHLRNSGLSRVMEWIDCLQARIATETTLVERGIDPRSVMGVNTREDLRILLLEEL
ncbi:MAG: NTP transferase domain-containing protein [Armatimonadetes bacterium]|nr:NTP transferase domain-containing protein [Armatimonadota bacterium]